MVHLMLLYTGKTIEQSKEPWVTILLEIDTKLARYAYNTPPGTVAADSLLRAFMWTRLLRLVTDNMCGLGLLDISVLYFKMIGN